MIKGTTPKHRFEISFDTKNIKDILITYSQQNEIILQKTLDNCWFFDEGNRHFIYTGFTEEDTTLFVAGIPTVIQIKLTLTDDHIIKSRKLMVLVRKAYDEIGK